MALSVLAAPSYDWIVKRIPNSSLAAAVACFLVAIVILAPTVAVTAQVVNEVSTVLNTIQNQASSQQSVEAALASHPQLARIADWSRTHIDWDREIERFRVSIGDQASRFFGGVIWTGVNILVALFLMFYFFRDRHQMLSMIRFLLPLSDREAKLVMHSVGEMIQGTLYGSLVVAGLQGALGGLMFWILGLKGALLWGVLMGLLSVIPMLGAFAVWLPAAAYLAAQGEWTKAIVLGLWGAVVIGLIDNWLFPILVGKNTRMHTVPMFIAIVGGLYMFGAAGIVLGPVALIVTWSLIEVWRRRSEQHDGFVEQTA